MWKGVWGKGRGRTSQPPPFIVDGGQRANLNCNDASKKRLLVDVYFEHARHGRKIARSGEQQRLRKQSPPRIASADCFDPMHTCGTRALGTFGVFGDSRLLFPAAYKDRAGLLLLLLLLPRRVRDCDSSPPRAWESGPVDGYPIHVENHLRGGRASRWRGQTRLLPYRICAKETKPTVLIAPHAQVLPAA